MYVLNNIYSVLVDFYNATVVLKNNNTGVYSDPIKCLVFSVNWTFTNISLIPSNMCEGKIIDNLYHARCAYRLDYPIPHFPIYNFISESKKNNNSIRYSFLISKTVASSNVFPHPNDNFGQTKTELKRFVFEYKEDDCCQVNFNKILKAI